MFFGDFFNSSSPAEREILIAKRIGSYDFLLNFIERQHVDWSVPPNTEYIVSELRKELSAFDNQTFAFMVCHTGYIPELYPADSSQETLYTKLIETIVVEWAVRIGFTESTLPTQKSSKEDVTIKDIRHVIVCDAKSFRLGRSQGAPNVKDVLKHADISKWLLSYPELSQLGGLVTFPSQHDWKKGSDFYQYTTDHRLPTICLNYEHMSFFLLCGYDKNKLIETYRNYENIFPAVIDKARNNRDIYYSVIERALFGDNIEEWNEFKDESNSVVSEFVYHCKDVLSQDISSIKNEVTEKYNAETDINKLRRLAIESEVLRRTEDLNKQLERIDKFRTPSDDYL